METHPSHGNHPPARQWYVQVDEQPYGPFDDAALWKFMCEGRVSPQSLVSNSPNSGYRAVSADPGLMSWLAQTPQAMAASVPATQAPEAAPTVFMIMGEIRSGRGMEFLRTLQSLGQVQRIGDTVWLLQARAKADDVRDVLSQPLGPTDRLFVLDSFANAPAWFNLSPQMDEQIAALWDTTR